MSYICQFKWAYGQNVYILCRKTTDFRYTNTLSINFSIDNESSRKQETGDRTNYDNP